MAFLDLKPKAMKTKIVYVLVSNEEDYFLEQALMSIYSLRMHNPDVTVELVTDARTETTLTGKRGTIRSYINNVLIADVPTEYDNLRRSRHLKVNLRRIVSGDYLFIDCDTVICKPLDPVDLISSDLGMVADLNGPLNLTEPFVIEKGLKAGFSSFEGEPYFNSGVIYAKDTATCHDFYSLWHENWLKSTENGDPNDQPALCETNRILANIIAELSGQWNCQIKFHGIHHVKDARIIHYYSGKEQNIPSAENLIYYNVKQSGCIDAALQRALASPEMISTLMTIRPDKTYQYLSSPLLNVFFNQKRFFKHSERLTLAAARLNKRLHKMLSK